MGFETRSAGGPTKRAGWPLSLVGPGCDWLPALCHSNLHHPSASGWVPGLETHKFSCFSFLPPKKQTHSEGTKSWQIEKIDECWHHYSILNMKKGIKEM